MTDSLLIQRLGNSPNLKVIDFLIDNIGLDYSKKEIAKGSGISIMTLNRIWSGIEPILAKTRKFGKAQLYTLNKDNSSVKEIRHLEKVLIKENEQIDIKSVTELRQQ